MQIASQNASAGLPVTGGRSWIRRINVRKWFPCSGDAAGSKICAMSPVTAAAVLVGRDDELALLDGLLREAARGRGAAVLIEGEPGIGKSALVHAAVAAAPDAGCQVFWGAGDELGTALPLLPFLDALQVREPSVNARRNTIVGLLRGEIAADRGADVPATLAEQLLALVAEESAVRPVVLVIDDLQWADPASVALWGRLARTARQAPLLLIGTARPVPHRDDLLALRRHRGRQWPDPADGARRAGGGGPRGPAGRRQAGRQPAPAGRGSGGQPALPHRACRRAGARFEPDPDASGHGSARRRD